MKEKKSENFLNERNIKITKRLRAYRGYASTYNVDILSSFNPELTLKDTESAIQNKLINLLSNLRRFKFVTILVLEFIKLENDDETKFITFYSNSKAETIINESDIDDTFESVYTTITSNTQKYLEKGSGLIIYLVIDNIINISKYNSLAGSSYMKLPKELHHSRKGLVNTLRAEFFAEQIFAVD